MFERIEMMRMARAMGHHVAQRQIVTARNIANADTPGYRATDLPAFADSYRSGSAPAMRATRAGHLPPPNWADRAIRPVAVESTASPNGNSVSLEAEMVRAAELKRQHDMAIGIYRSALNLMRSSIGRR
ncbi:FlgB family protein [Paracoccus bogoriensis]|uniref:FlgB family protein n=1 Tax=Paracoccus bogoriensis TaxID=242065 RepID=UPI001CA48406|nr:FlgB family protein [Paracoccus bogoriensis]MBW7055905.1 FlgB family protein [Paracoccus bogoriensis]